MTAETQVNTALEKASGGELLKPQSLADKLAMVRQSRSVRMRMARGFHSDQVKTRVDPARGGSKPAS